MRGHLGGVGRALPHRRRRRAAAEVSLPVVSSKTTIRPSKSGRRRAAVLLLVHLLVAVHIAQWLSGRPTLTPLEPSEAMEFSKQSIVNAGLIFFALTILSTLVLGRWFCGWACHLVALQDLCRWILLKLGLRPRPGRLGLLGVVPLSAFVYMFLAPVAYRVLHGDPLGVRGVHLTTDSFWATFPSWLPAVLTFLTCGFAAVYFLGAKGFCTYGCPYGAIFGVADQFAVGSIRVTDACTGSGHCTAVCSSNVRVHEEVRDYGMVVDPGCMKCLDCVSVCPNDALYFGLGRPSVLARRRTAALRKLAPALRRLAAGLPEWTLTGCFVFAAYSLFMWYDGDFDWRISTVLTAGTLVVVCLYRGRSRRLREYNTAEQAALGTVFLGSIFVFRGLYGLVPFLFSLGLAAVLAYLFLFAVRLLYRRDLGLHRWSLKRAGRMRPAGVTFAAAGAAAIAFAAHSAVVQYHTVLGRHAARAAALDSGDVPAVRAALHHVRRAHDLALLPNPYDLATVARLHLLEGDAEGFERAMRDAIAGMPLDADLRMALAEFYAARARVAEALEQYRHAAAANPRHLEAHVGVGRWAAMAGRPDEARAAFEQALGLDPDRAVVHFNYGVLEATVGRDADAIARFERAVAIDPGYVEARENLAGMYCSVGRYRDGAAHFEEALRLRPGDAATHELAARAYLALGQLPQATDHLRAAVELAPDRRTAKRLLMEVEAARPARSP